MKGNLLMGPGGSSGARVGGELWVQPEREFEEVSPSSDGWSPEALRCK